MRGALRRWGAAANLSLLVAGCDSTSPPAEPDVSLRGDTTVLVAAEPRYPDGGKLAPEITIGTLAGDDEYVFGDVRDAVVGSDGSVYVLDSQAQLLRRYRPDGTFVSVLAGPGDGPGELRSARFIAGHPDGRIRVGEVSGAVHAIDPRDGTSVRWNLGVRISGPLVVDRDGLTHVPVGLVPGRSTDVLDDPGRITAGGPFAVEVVPGEAELRAPGTVRAAPDGTVRDTLPAPEIADLANYLTVPVGRVYIGLDYRPRAWWAWSPLGYEVTGRTDRYQIDLHLTRADGSDSILSVRLDREAIPLTPGERDALARQIEVLPGGGHGEWRWDWEIPDRKPLYHRVLLARDGRLWVRTHVPSVERSGADGGVEWHEPESAFDVFEPSGEYVGRVRGPPGIRATWGNGDTLLAVSTDDLGVDRVVRFVAEWE